MGIHPFYRTEMFHLESFESFQPQLPDPERIHTINIGDGMELGVMVGMTTRNSDVLRVGFHAAKSAKGIRGHVFSPVEMARASGDSYLLFSDPTLTISERTILSWYLGTPEINPDDWMERFVRRTMECTGARYLIIEGSSGGGFTALRFASRFRNAVAVPKIPQTDLFRYLEGPLAHTMRDAGWSSWTYGRVLAECPQRFRIADIYNDELWHRRNLIHYVQNAGDTSHMTGQLAPFLSEIGAKDSHVFSALGGLCSVSRPFTGGGHVPIPREHWIAENAFAIKRLRRLRPHVDSEPSWREPESHTVDTARIPARAQNINLHLPGNKTW